MGQFLDFFTRALQNNFILSTILAFGAGLAAGFSPCFLPLVPVTLAVLSGNYPDRKKFILAVAVYVLGIATVYTVLGVVSAAFGGIFGKFSNSLWVKLAMGNIMLLLGLSVLGWINLPYFSFNPMFKRRQGLFFVYLLGCLSAFSLGGCIFPVLGAILSIIALGRNIVYGAVVLFSFSLGVGFLFFLAAFLGREILNRLRAGNFSRVVNKILGITFILVAEYFFVSAGRVF